MAIGYLLGKGSARLFKVNFNIPLILTLSIIPDVDLIFQFFLRIPLHRGPTHSLISAIVVFIPFFWIYRQKAAPYFAALASHFLIGDFFIGGQIQLLWPLSTNEYGFRGISILDPVNIALEFTLFAITLIAMFKTRDILRFFGNSKLNLILTIPIFTVLLPTFVSYQLYVPFLLVVPHLFYLLLFSISVAIALKGIFKY